MIVMSGFALMLALQSPPPEVVVVGQRLVEIQAACVRDGCSARRDAQASIALAEQQFRQGRYRDARLLLASAVARNRGRAATDPKPVSALYEAYATILLHDGDMEPYRRAVAGQVRTLRDNLPPGDPTREAAATALGEMWVKRGSLREAEQVFVAGERQAIAEGQPQTAIRMAIRRVTVLTRLGADDRAQRLLEEIGTRPEARDPRIGPVLRVLRLRMMADRADPADVDRMVAEIGQAQGTRPTLVWAAPYEPTAAAAAEDAARRFDTVSSAQDSSSQVGRISWVDVGFWIRPDGRTGEAEILRGSPGTEWTAPVLRQIGSRRYTTAAAVEGPGSYQIERFSLRGVYSIPKGSNIRRRGGARRLEALDLTEPPASVGTKG